MSGFILGAVFVLLVIAVVIYMVTKKRTGDGGGTWVSPEPTTRKNEPVAVPNELDQMFGKLADLLLELRISGASQSVFDAARQVVDGLVQLLPKFTAEYGHTELAFVLVQIGKNYLPNLLTPYSKLSRQTQQANEGELQGALTVLMEEIVKVQGIYERGEVNRFETEATFLKHRFLGESIEASSELAEG